MKQILLFSGITFTVCTAFVAAAIINYASRSNPEFARKIEEGLEGMKEKMRPVTVGYKHDNTYTIQSTQGLQAGKWAFYANNKNLIINQQDEPARVGSLLKITPHKLLIFNKERSDTTLYIHP